MFYRTNNFEPVEEIATDLWAMYGIPEVLIADNSRCFVSAMFLENDVRLESDAASRSSVSSDLEIAR